MSRIVVEFSAEELEFELPDEMVVGSWSGPKGLSAAEADSALREALEHPRGYAPLRQCVVPGDRVAIALGAGLPEPKRVLAVLTDVLGGSGVSPDDIAVIAPPDLRSGPPGATIVAHDPEDPEKLAYLGATAGGGRVYLNRILTDADFVLPVGLLGYDPMAGRRGPWSVLFPGMSDAPTMEASRRDPLEEPSSWGGPPDLPSDAFEVGWLLGSQFQIGVVPGSEGPVEFVAGTAEEVRDQGAEAVDRAWRFRVESRAEVVLAGIGAPGAPTSLADLIGGLATASRLVQRGGRIVALSRAEGPIGPSLQRLAAAGETEDPPKALRGFESDPDSVDARRLAKVLAWADVYLLSGLDREVVEDLSMIPLGRPEDARKLIGTAASTFLSRAEFTWGEVERAPSNNRRSKR